MSAKSDITLTPGSPGIRHAGHDPVPLDLGPLLERFASVEAMRAASPLPDNAERLIDTAVQSVGRQRLALVDTLISRGLTFGLPNWMSVLALYNEKLGDAGHAERAVVPNARSERQVRDRGSVSLPIFVTFDDFRFNVRELGAAARSGAPLDTSGAEMATRNVNEAIEDQAINGLGTGVTINGLTAPGVINAPNANTQAFVDTQAWTHADHSGADIVADIKAMVTKLYAANRYGPYIMALPTTYDLKLNDDYASGYPKTIRQRLQEMTFGGQPLGIVAVDKMPTDTVALFQATSDVVRVVMGQQPVPVSWSPGPGWMTYYVVMSCIVTQWRSDYAGQSGVCIGTPSGS